MEEEEKQVETSPTLERKRAKYTVEDVGSFVAASPDLR